MSDWVDSLTGVGLVEQVNEQLKKCGTAFLDEGLSVWERSQEHEGFFQVWKRWVQEDCPDILFGVKACTQRINVLPAEPEDMIVSSLRRLGVRQEQWQEYLSRELSLSPAWMRFFRWLGEHPDCHPPFKHRIDPTQYLAVRMFYEVELTERACQQKWGCCG